MSAFDDYLASQAAPAAPPSAAPSDGGSMTMGADGIPRIVVSGTSEIGTQTKQTEKPDDFKPGPAMAAYLASQAPDPNAPAELPAPIAAAPQPLIGRADDLLKAVADAHGAAGVGALSGVADVGSNLINQGTNAIAGGTANAPSWMVDKPQIDAAVAGNAQRQAGLDAFNTDRTAANPIAFPVGRVAGNIAATLPLGEGLGGAAAAGTNAGFVGPSITGSVTPLIGRIAQRLAPVIDTGAAGYAQAAAVNPDDGLGGAVAGAFLPPVVKGLVGASNFGRRTLVNALAPASARDADFILRAGGFGPADIPAVSQQLATGAQDVAGIPLTTAQTLYDPTRPGTSGLAQLARNLTAAGDPSIQAAAGRANNARIGVLNQLAPDTGSTATDIATNFGNVAGPSIRAQNAAARKATRDAFDNVDNFNETAFHLPIGGFKAAISKYLPRGTVGMGSKANAILKEAEAIGQSDVHVAAVKPPTAKPGPEEKTLAQRVRAAGGIRADNESGKAFGGELAGLKETAGPGLVKTGSGVDIDKLAEILHGQGLIPDNDPATLIAHLHDAELRAATGHGADMDALHQRALEAMQGDLPGAYSYKVPVPIGFNSTQALRASIGNAIREVEAKSGRNPEWATLVAMQKALDDHVAEVAAGRGAPGEVFPPENVTQWVKARGLKQMEVERFGGPVTSRALRADAPNLEGGLAQGFYNAGANQGAAMNDFAHIENPELRAALRHYAVESMRGTMTAADKLSTKLEKFNDARSVANGALFTPDEVATLGKLSGGIKTANEADAANMLAGSHTAQMLKTMGDQGLLGKAWGGGLKLIPGIGKDMAASAASKATDARTARIGLLMADPARLRAAIPGAASLAERNARPLIGNMSRAAADQFGRNLPLVFGLR